MTRLGASSIWAKAIGSMTKARILALAGLLLLGNASAASDTAEQLLGGGVAITLPRDMKLKQNPTLFKMKDVEQWDYRLRSDEVSMALTGMGFTVPKDKAVNKIDTADIIVKSSAQYLPQSTGGGDPMPFENGRVSGHYASLRAREGQKFAVGFDAPRRCVTTAVIAVGAYNDMTISYSVTIAADDCDSAAYKAAVAGVVGMRPV